MSTRSWFAAVAVAAVLAGSGLWWEGRRPAEGSLEPAAISPGALWATSFADTRGGRHSLGELQGGLVVVNFWATWCVPCREEMPAFTRLNARWKDRGVRFVGLANDDAGKVQRFAEDLGVAYPLWLGGDSVGELSRRLGNRLGVLPHTVILDPQGAIKDARVGPYTEPDLERVLTALVPKGG